MEDIESEESNRFKFQKIVSLGLTLILTFSFGTSAFAKDIKSIPVYSSIEQWEASGDNSYRVRIQNKNLRYDGVYTEYVYSREVNDNDVRVGYHPDCEEWRMQMVITLATLKKPLFLHAFH